jgi:cation transport regulator ChaC
VAYLVENHVLEQLDHREKNGYQRYDCRIRMQAATGETAGLVYVAPEHNPAYLGPADPAEVAAHIARSAGPSGSNSEYLLRLARALRELGDEDEHVLGLEALLLAGPGTPPQATLPGDSRHDRTTVAAAANSAAITTDQST